MRRAHVLALAVALAIAGCPGATPTERTVTPAPVPESVTPAGVPPCSIPAPSSTTATATPTSADPVSIPVQDRVVNATALIDRHDRVLREHSYQLSGPDLSVQANPETSALRVRAQSPILTVRHYVVDGTQYTFYAGPGGQKPYQVHDYDANGIPGDFGSFYSVTGSAWLADALAIAPHRVVGRDPHGGFELRAETGEADTDGEPPNAATRSIRSLESTVTVDRQGIIRAVEQQYEIVAGGEVVRTVDHSFQVIEVGKTTVERPRWVCIAERNGFFENA